MLPSHRVAAPVQQRGSSASSSRPVFGSSFLRGGRQQFSGAQVAAARSSGEPASQRRVTVMAAKGEVPGGAGGAARGMRSALRCGAAEMHAHPTPRNPSATLPHLPARSDRDD